MQKNTFQLFFLGFIVLVSCNSGNDYLPKKLGNLTLIKTIKNEKATRIINKMHGKKLDVSDNFIAYYGSKNSRNILYATVYRSSEKAQNDLISMVQKISKGSRVFTPIEPFKIGGNVYFQTEGMGLRHYFYRQDNILIWWQVETEKSESTYRDLIRYDFTLLKDRTG